MEQNNQGFSIPFSLVSLLLVGIGIALNAYVMTVTANIIEILSAIFMIIAFLFGLAYIAMGCKKDSSRFFKVYMFAFSAAQLVNVIKNVYTVNILGENIYSLVFIALIGSLSFAALLVLTFGLNLGKVNSYVLCGVVAVVSVADGSRAIINASEKTNLFIISEVCILALTVIMIFMVYAKYVDKAERNTK